MHALCRQCDTYSTSCGRTCKAFWPPRNTTRLCARMSWSDTLMSRSARVMSSASAALPLYSRKWLHALRFTAMMLSGVFYNSSTGVR